MPVSGPSSVQTAEVNLALADDEARDVQSALGVVVELLEQVTPGPGAVLTKASIPGLLRVARRLDHERRHKGAVPNPNFAEVERLREALRMVAQAASLNVTSRIAALTLQGYSTERLRNAL